MLPKHDAIGEVRLPVCQMDLAQAKEIWKDLQSIVGDGKVSLQINKAIPLTTSKALFAVKNQYLFFKVLCKRAYLNWVKLLALNDYSNNQNHI